MSVRVVDPVSQVARAVAVACRLRVSIGSGCGSTHKRDLRLIAAAHSLHLTVTGTPPAEWPAVRAPRRCTPPRRVDSRRSSDLRASVTRPRPGLIHGRLSFTVTLAR